MYRFGLEPNEVMKSLKALSYSRRRERAQRDSDRLWFELDELMTEDDKVYWASILKYAAELRRTSRRRGKPSEGDLQHLK